MTDTPAIETHGGDVERVAREYGTPANELLDFSVNINPRGLPAAARERLLRDCADPALLARYPDPQATELRQILARQLGISADAIAVGGGSAALIDACIRAFEARRCLIPVPAFAEYERACVNNKCSVEIFPLDAAKSFELPVEAIHQEIRKRGCDLLIVNNPHNPSGSILERREMLSLIELATAAGARVLIDEAFIDYVPGAEITGCAAGMSQVVALRSLTKFYGCPALRVGYLVSVPETVKRIAARLPAWPVTTLALHALAEAVRDEAYARASIEENERERSRLSQALAGLGFHVFPSATNFLLLRLPDDSCSSAELRRRLIVNHKIIVRTCDSFAAFEPGRYIRVAIKAQIDNNYLLDAVRMCGIHR